MIDGNVNHYQVGVVREGEVLSTVDLSPSSYSEWIRLRPSNDGTHALSVSMGSSGEVGGGAVRRSQPGLRLGVNLPVESRWQYTVTWYPGGRNGPG